MNFVTAIQVFFLLESTVATVMATGHLMFSISSYFLLQSAGLKYPEFFFETNQLIEYLGYPCEIHQVTTEDGYILKVFRIPYGKSGRGAYSKRPPVYLEHGVLGSSDDYVMSNANQSLGFMLADAGFDVWLGNARGNQYSFGHIPPIPSPKEYFNFSFDQVGEFDHPAMIDHILKVTGYKELQYIGHFMGVTTCLAMLSTKTEYNFKVRHFHALAPIAWLNYVRAPSVRRLAPNVNKIQLHLDEKHYYNFLPNNEFTKLFGLQCDSIISGFCKTIMGLVCGPDPYQLNTTRLPILYSHYPSGTSTNTMAQLAQVYNSGKFQKYDYGIIGNLRKYNQSTPPEYDLSKVSTKVSLYWGQNDFLADPRDVAHLRAKLPNCVDFYRVPYSLYSHMDFVFAIDNAKLLYNYLISKLDRY